LHEFGNFITRLRVFRERRRHAQGLTIDAPERIASNETRRLALIVRNAMHPAANPVTCREVSGCKPQNLLRALRLTLLFTALASTPGVAEDVNNAGASPAASVSMDHNTFIPDEITVVPGTTVTWVNKEAMPHTVVDVNKGFRSKTLPKDAAFSFTFTAAGDYNYLCSIHPNMKGKVIVKPQAS
jgi:amicyanin